MKYLWPFLLLFCAAPLHAQHNASDDILETIVRHYYKNEKPVVKGRATQHLFVYCDTPNNNEELFETINQLKLPKETASQLKQQVRTDTAPASWSGTLDKLLTADERLRVKVNECLSLERYQEKQRTSGLNTHRLMIISKPVFFHGGKSALVKLVFYRTIEHNKGSVLHMELQNGKWIIKEHRNAWET